MPPTVCREIDIDHAKDVTRACAVGPVHFTTVALSSLRMSISRKKSPAVGLGSRSVIDVRLSTARV